MPAGSLQQRRSCLQPSEAWWVPGATLLGVVVGLLEAALTSQGSASVYDQISAIIGWTYFCMWSVSFYPQVVQNFVRKSVRGLSLEYQLLNFVGFGFYFIYNIALYAIPSVQDEYKQRFGHAQDAVELNDVFFAGHAMTITLVTLLQMAVYYDHPQLHGWDKAIRQLVLLAVSGFCLVAVVLAVVVMLTGQRAATWLSYVTILSSIKVFITVVKYCPQVFMNWRRGSTDGWSIHNVLLDFSGGFLSTLQLVFDCWRSGHWNNMYGDPAKLLLGNVSIVFDIIFMVQHYCLYRKEARDLSPGRCNEHTMDVPLSSVQASEC